MQIMLNFENCESMELEVGNFHLHSNKNNVVFCSGIFPNLPRLRKKDITSIEVNNKTYIIPYKDNVPGQLGSENINQHNYSTTDGKLIIMIG